MVEGRLALGLLDRATKDSMNHFLCSKCELFRGSRLRALRSNSALLLDRLSQDFHEARDFEHGDLLFTTDQSVQLIVQVDDRAVLRILQFVILDVAPSDLERDTSL